MILIAMLPFSAGFTAADATVTVGLGVGRSGNFPVTLAINILSPVAIPPQISSQCAIFSPSHVSHPSERTLYLYSEK